MACRNCTDICNCAVVSGNTRATVSGTGTAADPYTVTVAAVVQTETFTYPGTLVVNTGTVRRTFSHAATITNVGASVGTSPTGTSVIVDVNKNGTTIFSGAKPTIAVGDDDAGVTNTPTTTAIAALDYLTIDIDQIGSGVAGADLTVTIEYYR